MFGDARRTWRYLSPLCLAIFVWPATAAWTSAQDFLDAPDDATARRLFLEIETARRLPAAAQAERLPRLYRDVCPQLQRMYAAHTMLPGLAAPTNADETLNAAADRIGAGGWPALGEAGRQRCRAFLAAHRDGVEVLAREDLRVGSRRDRRWALHVIGELRARPLFDAVIAALGDPEPIDAAQALRDLDDPRAIPPLIRRFPDEPTRFFEALRSLQRGRPAHPLLLPLLQAKEATTRWQAAYALAESRDPALVPVIASLVADPAADVRRQAGYMAVMLEEANYRRARPSVAALLSDIDISVRADVAVAMATSSQKDRASAPALLALVKLEDTLEPWRQSNVVQAIHTLTGTYFGLTPGTPSPAPVRAKALADFARWIEEH